jgi:DNA-binding transcriptional LysR family regulator
MAGALYDCYVLAATRSADLAERFLNHFLPEREPSFAAEDPAEVLGVPESFTLPEVLQFLEAHREREHTMYWRNTRAESPFHAIVAFGADGGLVLGLSVPVDDDGAHASAVLTEMKAFASADHAYAIVDEPPVLCQSAFIALAAQQSWRSPKH